MHNVLFLRMRNVAFFVLGQRAWQKWRSPTSTGRSIMYSVAYKFKKLNLMSHVDWTYTSITSVDRAHEHFGQCPRVDLQSKDCRSNRYQPYQKPSARWQNLPEKGALSCFRQGCSRRSNGEASVDCLRKTALDFSVTQCIELSSQAK